MTLDAQVNVAGRVAWLAPILVFLCATTAATGTHAQEGAPWQVVGTQGLVQFVIVPKEQERDAAAYKAEIARLCPAGRTCFINFYTNASGKRPEMPLPDAIAAEATARFRRSTKNGVEQFQWSCRLGTQGSEGQCF